MHTSYVNRNFSFFFFFSHLGLDVKNCRAFFSSLRQEVLKRAESNRPFLDGEKVGQK